MARQASGVAMVRSFFVNRREQWERLRPVAKRFSRALPWVSLAWGVTSGILLTRGFDSARKVLVFAIALLVTSAALGLWTTWVERLAAREGEPARGDFGALALRHRERIDWIAVTITQIFAQYIFMFSVPFLWSARAWLHLFLCLALIGTILWDPLFTRLVRSDTYRLALRGLGLALAASFLVGILAPRHFAWVPEISLAAAGVGVFPWRFFRSGLRGFTRIGVSGFMVRWVPAALLAIVSLVHVKVGGAFRFPVLAVWVRKPRFVWQDANGAWDVRTKWFPEWRTTLLGDDMSAILRDAPEDGGGRLCCVTPLIAPRAVQSDVVHEWWVGGERVDTIELPGFQGRDEDSAYRTYSCKKNLPDAVRTLGLECRVFLGSHAGERVQIGRIFANGSGR